MRIAVIGTGRVGLPLALFLCEKGAEVIGIDRDPVIRKAINEEHRMPFREPGFDEIAATGKLKIHDSIGHAEGSDYYVITVGTPLMPHIEADMSGITEIVSQICEFLRPGQTLVLRSTLAPRTTQFLKNLVRMRTGLEVGKDVFLACCPERLLEGHAKRELDTLPQIIGADDEESRARASKLFALTEVKLMQCDTVTAELVKLFNNSSRYVYFAMANFMAMAAFDHGADPLEVLKLANEDYPRPFKGVPGFTAGTCLRKDFGMLSEGYRGGDLLIDAWRINESLPEHLVKATVDRWGSYVGQNVCVLGYAFKADTDDVRDTLAAKLVRAIVRNGPPKQVTITDPFTPEESVELPVGCRFERDTHEALRGADLVFVATNHSVYSDEREKLLSSIRKDGIRTVDVWDVLRTGNIFSNGPTNPER